MIRFFLTEIDYASNGPSSAGTKPFIIVTSESGIETCLKREERYFQVVVILFTKIIFPDAGSSLVDEAMT